MQTQVIHISKMTGKLDGFKAISSNTITNPYCIKQNASADTNNICTKCYSHTMLKSYRKNMQPSLERNSQALANSAIGTECPSYKQGGKCLDCRQCWDKSIPNVSYKYH